MVWVNGNATEHIYNDVYSHCLSVNGSIITSDDLYTQLLLSDFYGSVREHIELITQLLGNIGM